MLDLLKCLGDVVKAWPRISVGTQTGSLKIGPLLIQWGHTSYKMGASSAVGEKSIAFPVKFSGTPGVWGQCTENTNYSDLFNVTVHTISETGFTMGFRNNYTTKYELPAVWIAIGAA